MVLGLYKHVIDPKPLNSVNLQLQDVELRQEEDVLDTWFSSMAQSRMSGLRI